jgi:hypothetical protein
MTSGTHYGTIPGCGEKPVLFKPGAEKILTTFRIACRPEVEDLSTSDERRYRVTCRGITPNGLEVGAGVGEASTNEEKFKWRKAICDEEWDATHEDHRREKWGKYQGKAFSTKQVRTNPADLANTVLKIAKKRSMIDLCLTATAASDVFDQDLEDLPAEIVENLAGKNQPTVKQPARKTPPVKAAPKPTPKAAPTVDPIAEPSAGSPPMAWRLALELEKHQQMKAAPKPTPKAAPTVDPIAEPYDDETGEVLVDLSAEGVEIPEDDLAGMNIPSPEDLAKWQTAQGVIKAVTDKPAKTGGKRFGVLIDGTWYGSFNESLGAYAQRLKGATVILWYESSGEFKNFMWLREA